MGGGNHTFNSNRDAKFFHGGIGRSNAEKQDRYWPESDNWSQIWMGRNEALGRDHGIGHQSGGQIQN